MPSTVVNHSNFTLPDVAKQKRLPGVKFTSNGSRRKADVSSNCTCDHFAMAVVGFLCRQLKLAALLGENAFLEIEGTH